MRSLKIICFFASSVILCVNGGVLPVEKCKLEDSTCMTAAFQKAAPIFIDGIPELGVGVLDVLEMEDFSFDLSGLQFGLKGGKLKGLKTAVFDNVKWDVKQKHFIIEMHLDCSLKGRYTAAGRILVLPITGDGEMKLKLKHLIVKLDIGYEIKKGSDGKDYVVPKKTSFEFDVKENANFQLSNLFNGNKQLSDPMHKFLNDNWKEISTEFGKPIIEVAVKQIHKNMVTFFKGQPLQDIAQY